MKALITYVFIFLLMVSSASALTVLSVDNVDIQSNSAQVAGKQWVLDVVLGQMNDKVVGVIKKDSLKTTDTDGKSVVAENDLYLDAEVTTKSCIYTIDNQIGDWVIMTAEQKKMTGWPLNDETECYEQGGNIFIQEPSELNGRCIFLAQEAKHALVNFQTYQTAAEITLTVDGDSQTGTISNFESPDLKIGTVAHADWVGNLVSGDLCEDADDKGVDAIIRSDGNFLTSASAYQSYKNYIEDLVNSEQFDSYNGKTQDIVDTINRLAQAAMNNKEFRSTDGSVAYVNGNTARIDLKKAIQFPEVRLRINADYLTILIQTGKPSILSASPVTFTEGNGGTAGYGETTISYKNAGAFEGSFSLAVICEDNVKAVGSVNTFKLAAGASDSLKITLESIKDVSAQSEDTCTATMTERNSGEVSSKTFKVTVLQQTFCISGDSKCVYQKAFICNSAGQWIADPDSDENCYVGCSSDDDCDDNDESTIDTCESEGLLGGKKCIHKQDDDSARKQCVASGGKFVTRTTDPAWWMIWKDPTTTSWCLDPHLSILGLVLLIVGILGLVLAKIFLGGFPPVMILSVLTALGGVVLLVIGGIGIA